MDAGDATGLPPVVKTYEESIPRRKHEEHGLDGDLDRDPAEPYGQDEEEDRERQPDEEEQEQEDEEPEHWTDSTFEREMRLTASA
jgi:hypothetical protein